MRCFFLLGNWSTPEINENEVFTLLFRKRNKIEVIELTDGCNKKTEPDGNELNIMGNISICLRKPVLNMNVS